jgi:TolB protein
LRNGVDVAGDVSLSDNGLEVEFAPTAELEPLSSYELVIATGLRDVDGDALAAEYRGTFTTGPAAKTAAQIAFASCDFMDDYLCNVGIYLLNEDGSGERRIADGDMPAWSPDGKTIAFVDASGCEAPSSTPCFSAILTMNADGSGVKKLTSVAGSAWLVAPAWSPDGHRVSFTAAFIHDDFEAETRIYVVNSDGTGLTYFDMPGRNTNAIWSPDGQKIAFSSDRDGNYEIYVMNADGTNPVRLTSDPANDWAGSWSPDASRIAFTRAWHNPDSCQIFVMKSDGSNTAQITHDSFCVSNPAWAPAGDRIAFARAGSPPYGMFLMNPNGAGMTQIRPLPIGNATWAPIAR